MNSSNFRLPASYYEPKEEKLHYIACTDCDEILDGAKNAADLKSYDCCPFCKSENLTIDQDWFEV